jgi:DNA-binding transcriptional MerR regulator
MSENTYGVKIPSSLHFRIGKVSKLVGVETHVLRYWESEFRMRPARSPSGHRMYHRKNVIQFLRIKHLLHGQGYTISGARKAIKGDAEEVSTPVVDAVLETGSAPVGLESLSQTLAEISKSRTVISALLKQLS